MKSVMYEISSFGDIRVLFPALQVKSLALIAVCPLRIDRDRERVLYKRAFRGRLVSSFLLPSASS